MMYTLSWLKQYRPSLSISQEKGIVSITAKLPGSGFTHPDFDVRISPDFKRSNHPSLCFRQVRHQERQIYAWYKLEGFDRAYEAVKDLLPEITEEECWMLFRDTKLLEYCLYDPKREGCLKQQEVRSLGPFSHYEVWIHTSEEDLEANFPYIKEYLIKIQPFLEDISSN